MKVPRKFSVVALVALTATLTVTGTHPGVARAASATVDIPSPAGAYAPLDISIDGPGTVQISTAALDASGIYDRELWPNPITCWTTAARQAITSSAPVMRFDNSAQARPSASTVARVADATWNYSTHTFVVPAGISCARNLVDINPSRFITTLAERGFVCKGVVAANSVAVVSVT